MLGSTVGLLPENAGPLVHLAGDLHVPPTAEDRASPRIRIEEGEIIAGKRDAATFVAWLAQLLRAVQEEGELRFGRRALRAGHRQQDEFVGAVDGWEHAFAVLEVEHARDRVRIHQVGEEALRRGVERDAGRADHPDPPGLVDQPPIEFGERGIVVDVAAAGEGKAPALAHEEAGGFGVAAS